MSTHFPTYTEIKNTEYKETITTSSSDLNLLYSSWLSSDKIKLALNSFKDKKTPGPGGMKPMIFKHFPDNIINTLQIVYKPVIKLHFTPFGWKEARVIFIPKPGKSDYSTPKAFRPISLRY